jgi:hypothetical protein
MLPDTIAFACAMHMPFPATALKGLVAIARDSAVGGPAGTGMSFIHATLPGQNALHNGQANTGSARACNAMLTNAQISNINALYR